MSSASVSAPSRTSGETLSVRSVLLIVNPRSGRGRADRIGALLETAIGSGGFEVERVDISVGDPGGLDGAIGRAPEGAAAVIVGGDGTVHSAAGALAGAGIPVYHVPTGTENLFARQFRMRASADAVLAALRAGRVSEVDMGECGLEDAPGDVRENGSAPVRAVLPRPFLVMGSIGFDAGVIHRLAAARRGAISHFSYVAPIVRELLSHSAPALSITVDGRPIVSEARGLVIVANSRQYAMRLDPAHGAEMNDGLLDVVFFPARWLGDVSAWALLARLRLHHRRRALVTARGREVLIRAAGGRALLQLDGEAIGLADATEGAWRFGVRPGALRVLGS